MFEYLGARRPILAWTPSGGIVGELLDQTGAGTAVSSRGELKRVLASWLGEFGRTGNLSCRGSEQEVGRYGWEELAGRFAELFDRVAGR